jgi:hypothetical protein
MTENGPKFKKGDRVRVVKESWSHADGSGHRMTKGTEATIEWYRPDGNPQPWYRLDNVSDVFENEVELVEQPLSKPKPKAKSYLSRYHFFASESNPVDIERVAKENPDAVGGVVVFKTVALVWLRQEFCDQFQGRMTAVFGQWLSPSWGRSEGSCREVEVSTGYISTAIREIKAAKAHLESRVKPAVEPQQKPKVNPAEKRTKVTVVNF